MTLATYLPCIDCMGGGRLLCSEAAFALPRMTTFISRRAGAISLDVWELSTAAGANTAQREYWAGNGQQWQLESAGGGYYRIRSRLSNHVLDVNDVSTADGANAIQWTVTGGINQQWRFIPQ